MMATMIMDNVRTQKKETVTQRTYATKPQMNLLNEHKDKKTTK